MCTGCGSKVSYISSGGETGVDAEDEAGDEDGYETENVSENETGDSLDSALTGQNDRADESDSEFGSESQSDKLAVYVCGAVAAPGVYYFDSGDIKSLALEAAGGFADGAAADYVNLAEKLQDGEKLYFPYEAEVEAEDIKYDTASGTVMDEAAAQGTESTSSGKVNINTADKTELMTLPGIGESKAELIVSYRESNGSFGNIEDIMKINGIKDGVYGKIKDYITVD
jgi:competence protein ComEA